MAKIVTGQSKPYDVSQAGFPYGAVRDVLIDGVPCTMFRISYVGENGWEIYTKMEHGLRLWDTIWEAGEEFDIRPIGIGVYAVTGRIEKGYRLMGAELESEYNPVEAGLARPKVKSADFIGKEAYLAARATAEPVQRRCARCRSSTTPSPTASRATRPAATSRSSRIDGERIVDAHGRVVAGHHRRRRAVARHATCCSPTCRPSTRSRATSCGSMYMNELFPVTVARVGSQPLFDPDDTRMKT